MPEVGARRTAPADLPFLFFFFFFFFLLDLRLQSLAEALGGAGLPLAHRFRPDAERGGDPRPIEPLEAKLDHGALVGGKLGYGLTDLAPDLLPEEGSERALLPAQASRAFVLRPFLESGRGPLLSHCLEQLPLQDHPQPGQELLPGLTLEVADVHPPRAQGRLEQVLAL